MPPGAGGSKIWCSPMMVDGAPEWPYLGVGAWVDSWPAHGI